MQRSEIVDQVRFSTLKTTGDIADADINALIDLCMSEISVASRWPFLQTSATVTAVADQQNYSLPADFLYGVALVDDDNDQGVPYIAPEEFFRRYGNDTGNSSGTADYWTIWGAEILLTPIPSTADTDRWTLYYYRTITALTQDTDEPEFHEAFHYGIADYCKWRVWEREEFLEQSRESRLGYYTMLDNMKKWYGTQTLRIPYIWGDGSEVRKGDPNIPSLYRV